jgi:hypothetical protein
MTAMTTWDELVAAEPDFAKRVRALFDAHKHKVLATLRQDGSPRVSGIEIEFNEGQLLLGMMHGSRKALDLRRDPRFALHGGSSDPPDDPTAWAGDVKISGHAVEVTDPAEMARYVKAPPPGPYHLFRLDLAEVALIRVGEPADHLVIEFWRPGVGLRRMERR